jgi:hypothetical protein
MHNRTQISQLLRPLIISVAAGLVVVVGCLELFAQQTNPLVPSSCLPSASSVPTDARALLPLVPSSPDVVSQMKLPPGVSAAAPAPIQGSIPAPDPDNFKVLYGYSGPYYNTANLDGQVAVIGKSLYAWPISTWKVSGMLRNQTRCPVHIIEISARLLGSHGELLSTATATVPVAELRPGEPGPFIMQASLASQEISSVDWHIVYVISQTPSRPFTFDIYEEGKVLNDSRYDLVGSIRSLSTTTARGVRVVVAWLDEKSRVVYLDDTKIRLTSDPTHLKDEVDVAQGRAVDFLYITSDSALISALADARVALWGTSK